MNTISRLWTPFADRLRHPGVLAWRRGVATGRANFAAISRTILLWQDRARERTHLASLDDRMLRDIGLSRVDVARESSKPFWRA